MEFVTIKIPKEYCDDMMAALDKWMEDFIDRLGKDFYDDELKGDSNVSYENLSELDRAYIQSDLIAAILKEPEFGWIMDVYKNYINTL